MSATEDKVTKQVLKKWVQGEVSVRQINNKSKKSRITLSTPYPLQWPKLRIADEENICKAVEKTIKDCKVRKASGADEAIKKEPGTTWKDWNELKKKRAKKVWAESKQMRVHLALGLSQVIRCLEKDQLCAVLLCRNVEPAMMIEPLLMLCASRDVHAAAVSNLGIKLRVVLNFKSCRALGLKRSVAKDKSNSFHTLYETIKAKAEPLPKEFLKLREPLATVSTEHVKAVGDDDSSSKELDSNAPVAMSQSPIQVIEPAKDYSHLYIKKADVGAVAAAAAVTVRTSGPAEDFISLSHIDAPPMPGMRGGSSQFLSGNLVSQYKELNVKRLRPSNKVKGKRKHKARVNQK